MRSLATALYLAAAASAAMRGTGLDDFLPLRLAERAEWRATHESRMLLPRQMANSTGNTTTTPTLKFATNATEKYRVTSLPDVDFDFGEMYSGLIPIDPGSNASQNGTEDSLFFVFSPKIGEPVDEVTIWLNGGPGCSSLMGWLQENGPVSWQPGTFKPVRNPYTWSNLTNMLWIEQPIGTGFSLGKPYAKDEIDVSTAFLKWFKQWQTVFGIQNYKIYLTGESYAGRYVPYIASAMLDSNDTAHFNVNGVLVYDPVIGEFDYGAAATAVPFVEANRNIFGVANQTDMDELSTRHAQCGFKEFVDKYLVFPPAGTQPPTAYPTNLTCRLHGIINSYVAGINPCFNPYSIVDRCPFPHDPLGNPGSMEWVDPGSTIYFRRPEVLAAMHAPGPELVNWTLCSLHTVFPGGHASGPQRRGDLSPDPIQGVLPKVIERTNRAMVVNGDWDYVIITNQTLLAIQNMTWNGAQGFQSAPSTPFVVEQVDLAWKDMYEANWGEPNPYEQGVTLSAGSCGSRRS